MKLIEKNAKSYNKKKSQICRDAEKLSKFLSQKIINFFRSNSFLANSWHMNANNPFPTFPLDSNYQPELHLNSQSQRAQEEEKEIRMEIDSPRYQISQGKKSSQNNYDYMEIINHTNSQKSSKRNSQEKTEPSRNMDIKLEINPKELCNANQNENEGSEDLNENEKSLSKEGENTSILECNEKARFPPLDTKDSRNAAHSSILEIKEGEWIRIDKSALNLELKSSNLSESRQLRKRKPVCYNYLGSDVSSNEKKQRTEGKLLYWEEFEDFVFTPSPSKSKKQKTKTKSTAATLSNKAALRPKLTSKHSKRRKHQHTHGRGLETNSNSLATNLFGTQSHALNHANSMNPTGRQTANSLRSANRLVNLQHT